MRPRVLSVFATALCVAISLATRAEMTIKGEQDETALDPPAAPIQISRKYDRFGGKACFGYHGEHVAER
jgi:hypothetical protein